MGSGQMMPELGSRISLISKADIRYEGRLFTVDPQECTIALANVRSFGTEDRETAYPIMPQPTVYDYILFRGSDIKDIRVVNNVTIPNDPAIMQMQMNQQPGFPPQQQPQMPQGGPMGQFGPFGNIQGPPMGAPQQPNQQQNQAQSPQQAQPSQATQSSPQQKPSSQQDSRSATPNQSRKSPTSDTGVQTTQRSGENQGVSKDKMQRNNQRNNTNNNNQQYRDRRDSGRNDGYRNPRMQPQHQQNQHQQNQQHVQQHQQQRGGYNSYNNRSRGGGSGRMPPMMRGPPHQNNFRQNNNPQNRQNNNNPQNLQNKPPNKSAKFEDEFDFEKGCSEFEELRSKLAKLKVGSEEINNPEQQVNGEVEKKDDSGNETSADPDQHDDYNGYDKAKSFFDNISCEANERSKGKTQRTDWRQERKLNTETFGPTMNRRGGMRGRGGYYRNQYGRPMNNYRGGGGQYRNNPNNRNRNPHQGGRTNNTTNNQGQQSQQSATTAAADK